MIRKIHQPCCTCRAGCYAFAKKEKLKWYTNTLNIIEECGFYQLQNDKLLIYPDALIKELEQHYLTSLYKSGLMTYKK